MDVVLVSEFIEKESKPDFGVSFPGFPGCITAGENTAPASKNECPCITLHAHSFWMKNI
jgi:predicted RNase H-like HicB family nuclease